ncbi:MAG: DEAD/DEAH box helicase [Candidatus Hodarchaeota archaeon]
MLSTTKFEQLGLIEPILRVCAEEQFNHPTEIQEKAIPHIIEGRDVIGEAATGSGKTLAFASGIIQQSYKGQGVQALVITPTRELAHQVSDMINGLSKHKFLRVVSVYGGVSINPQIRALRKADVVIATPGRLLDHINRGTIKLNRIKIFVLDEGDLLLDMGFIPDIKKIAVKLPRNRQTLLFSATISYDINMLAERFMDNPVLVEAKSYVDPHLLTQVYYDVKDSLKLSLLVHLLQQNKGEGLSLIFCNTRKYSDFVTKSLKNAGIDATVLHGGYSQYERSKRLNKFYSHELKVLVATDVAARGLDIQGVSYVYNYDLPDTFKQYIHRIGRTARAGESGKAITLVSGRDESRFSSLFRYNHVKIHKRKTPYIKKIQSIDVNSSNSSSNKRKSSNRQDRRRKKRRSNYRY